SVTPAATRLAGRSAATHLPLSGLAGISPAGHLVPLEPGDVLLPPLKPRGPVGPHLLAGPGEMPAVGLSLDILDRRGPLGVAIRRPPHALRDLTGPAVPLGTVRSEIHTVSRQIPAGELLTVGSVTASRLDLAQLPQRRRLTTARGASEDVALPLEGGTYAIVGGRTRPHPRERHAAQPLPESLDLVHVPLSRGRRLSHEVVQGRLVVGQALLEHVHVRAVDAHPATEHVHLARADSLLLVGVLLQD